MAVVLRLMRAGAKKRPFYRIVAADSRRQRDGRFLEILGYYDPMATPATVKIEQDKVAVWLANGAQPSTQVASLLRQVGMKPTVGVKQAAVAAEADAAPAPKAKKKVAAKKKAVRRVKRTASARKTKKKAAKKKAAKKSAK
jgi:small subunit ribosomal protein S16